jgi:predicted transcriptional regulator
MYLTQEQRQQVISELTKNPRRLDSEIADLLGVNAIRVASIRRAKGFPNYSHVTRRKDNIQEELRQNPSLTNTYLSAKYNCSNATVACYREELNIPPAPRGPSQISEGTLKARAMLKEGTTLPDVHIASICGISFAHVARQRDVLGLPRSPRSNRVPSAKRHYDFTEIDQDIQSGIMSLSRITEKHNVPKAWVYERSRKLGVRTRKVTPEIREQVEKILQQDERPTTTVIAQMFGVSPSSVNNIRKRLGVKRLPPGLPKVEESKRAMMLLAEPNRKTLTQIAVESGLTVTTVTKIRNRMRNNGEIAK